MFSKKIFRKFVVLVTIVAFLSVQVLLWAKDKKDDEENPPKPLCHQNFSL